MCLHKSTTAKFYPFTDSDKDLLEKKRDVMVGGPSIIFTRKAVVGATLLRRSTNWCKSIVGIDTSQLYPFSMYQAMPSSLHTRWELKTQSCKFSQRENKTRSFENLVMSYFEQVRPQCKVRSFYPIGTQKKIDA